MIDKPVFNPVYHIEIVETEGVYLLSENSHAVLRGDFYCRLARLLDGRRTEDEIVDALADRASPAEVYYALGLMEQKRYVVDAYGAAGPERSAYWQALQLNSGVAEANLAGASVSVTALAGLEPQTFEELLQGLGLSVEQDGGFEVVLTDDYLRADLDKINAAALEAH
jgi:ribosomal protein S12 methylthiotransferase accessory factor